MFFSSIANAFPSTLNRLYQARDAYLQQGRPIVDLISGNVGHAGIEYPDELLREGIMRGVHAARRYQPDSFGQRPAREAIAAYYRRAGIALPPEQLLLTPGTSVSYLYCFKLLAESGDEILCPLPSYPLFETIAQLCDVRLTSYRLRESDQWEIDLDYLESQITTRTRAVVLISPHNPTGVVIREEQLGKLAEIVSRHQLPIIADEVFSEFLFGLDHLPRPAGTDAPLVFTLNGFSKMLALPGIKLGWLGVSGNPELVKKSMRTLEMISDTLLPVNESVQFAVPELLSFGQRFLSGYQYSVGQCRNLAVEILSACRCLALVPPLGGFYLTARWTGPELDEEAWVVDILEKCNILVHPGYFYEIPGAHLVMSFVQDLAVLETSLQRLRDFLD